MRPSHRILRGLGGRLLLAAPFLFLLSISSMGCSDPNRPVSNGGDATGDTKAAEPESFEGVEGSVTAPGGKPLAGVSVQPRSLDEPSAAIPEMAVVSEEGGQYRWKLRPGEYEITFALEGYQPASHRVTVRAGEATRLDVELKPVI